MDRQTDVQKSSWRGMDKETQNVRDVSCVLRRGRQRERATVKRQVGEEKKDLFQKKFDLQVNFTFLVRDQKRNRKAEIDSFFKESN